MRWRFGSGRLLADRLRPVTAELYFPIRLAVGPANRVSYRAVLGPGLLDSMGRSAKAAASTGPPFCTRQDDAAMQMTVDNRR
jgi:hypothetical protein